MEAPLLVFQESLLSPWAQRPQSRRTRLEDASPRFQTVGSLDVVNARVAEGGLQKRAPLPLLVVDTVDCIEPVMPPKRRVVAGGVSHSQPKHRPRNEQTAAPVEKEREKPAAVHHGKVTTKTSLIELATFPGYTPSSPTPLPQSLDTMEQMRRVTRAQAKLAAKREGYREYWRENFYSPASQTVFLDTFWWFFLERYQPHRAVQSSLFSRVAENYVKFLVKTEIHTWKDKFLKAYPDAIAQCVYTAFIHAFPASWSSFDAHFKSALVEIVYLWQTGTRPIPEIWKRWNFEFLDPPNSLRSLGQEEQPLKPSRPEKNFNLDALVEEARVAVEQEETPSISQTNDPQSRDSVEISMSQSADHTLNQSQQNISQSELERALSRKLFQDHKMSQDVDLSPRRKARSSKLDIARSQYLSLRDKRPTKPPHADEKGKMAPLPKMTSVTTHQSKPGCRTTKITPPEQTTKAHVPPPLPPMAPKGTTNNPNSHRHPKSGAPNPTGEEPASRSTQPATEKGRPVLRTPTTRSERPAGSLRSCTEAEELRGGTLMLNVGGKKYKKMHKEKALQLKEKAYQPPLAERRGMVGPAKQTETPPGPPGSLGPSSAQEEMGRKVVGKSGNGCKKKIQIEKLAHVKEPPVNKPHQQEKPCTQQPTHTERNTDQPPQAHTEKPAGSHRPVSAAEEYGLPNYVFKEGEKEKTWKEKALNVREKTRQRPINVLHKLHHQGTPLAVPEMDNVCFDLCGRSPLVKHYLQKRRLHKVTGYTMLTKRTEINQVIPSDAQTYDDVIQESLRESKEQSVLLATQKRQAKKQLRRILQERLKRRETYKRQLRYLLSAQKEVESLSSELVAYWEQRGVDKRQGVASLKHTLSPDMQRSLTSCINKAFQNVTRPLHSS